MTHSRRQILTLVRCWHGALSLAGILALFAWAVVVQAQTRPVTAPATQAATQPVAKVIFITGLYSPVDASHGDDLNRYILSYWKGHYSIDLAMSVYDRDDEINSLLPKSGTIIIVAHSWGGDKAIAVAKANPALKFKLILIDPVPRLNKQFDLPDNVVWCWETYRTTRPDGHTPITLYISKPVVSGKWPWKNVIFIPPVQKDSSGKPITDPQVAQGGEHGAPVWDGTAAAAVKIAMQ